jgi:hypothetical protein
MLSTVKTALCAVLAQSAKNSALRRWLKLLGSWRSLFFVGLDGHTEKSVFNPEIPLEGAMIAQDFEFTGDFPIERNTQVYCRLRTISGGFKRLARARRLMGFPGSRANLAQRTAAACESVPRATSTSSASPAHSMPARSDLGCATLASVAS